MAKQEPVIVEIGNVFSYLRTEDVKLKALFNKSLSFRPKGYVFSPAYQKFRRSGGKRGWNGYTNFISLATGRFGTGLLPEILKGLDSLHRSYDVVDNRSSLDYTPITADMFENRTLRDYQVELGNSALRQRRGIIKSPTGSGKTTVFLSIVKALSEGVPTMVLFRSRTLVNQTYKEFNTLGIENVGRVHMDFFEPDIITCSTIQSIHHLEPLIPKVKAVILDECHEYTSNKSVRTVRSFENAAMILGFSATPFDRKDKVQRYTLKSLIGPILGEISTGELQGRNILAQSKIHIVPIVEPKRQHALFDEAYGRCIVENDHRNEMIAKITEKHHGSKILILVEKIEHGDNLKRLIPDALWVHGSTATEERDQAAEFLRSSEEGGVVIASRIWAQGVDIPQIEVLINASAGKSERSTIQKLGRGLRIADGKDYLEFYDFYDSTNRYLEKHSKERVKTYKREGHEIIPTEPL